MKILFWFLGICFMAWNVVVLINIILFDSCPKLDKNMQSLHTLCIEAAKQRGEPNPETNCCDRR